jgi:hypothetical protein
MYSPEGKQTNEIGTEVNAGKISGKGPLQIVSLFNILNYSLIS